MNIMAIIPARGGSKGVPGKNTRLLGGYPLLAYSIIAARLVKKIKQVIVSTDLEGIAVLAKEYGVEVPFLRPAELAQDHSTDQGFMFHAVNWFLDHEGFIPDYFVLLRPTTPLRDPDIIDAAITEIIRRPESSSLRSAHLATESPFKWFQRDEKGYFKALFNGFSNELLNNPRQQFPEVYIPNGYVDIAKPALMHSSGQLFGEMMLGFTSPACIEVDTITDLELLEYDLNKNGSLLWDYLKRYYPKNLKI